MKNSSKNKVIHVNVVRRMIDCNYAALLQKALVLGQISDDYMIDPNTSLLTYAAEQGRPEICRILLDADFEPELSRELKHSGPGVEECLKLLQDFSNGGGFDFEFEDPAELPKNRGSLDEALEEQKKRERFNYNETLRDWSCE